VGVDAAEDWEGAAVQGCLGKTVQLLTEACYGLAGLVVRALDKGLELQPKGQYDHRGLLLADVRPQHLQRRVQPGAPARCVGVAVAVRLAQGRSQPRGPALPGARPRPGRGRVAEHHRSQRDRARRSGCAGAWRHGRLAVGKGEAARLDVAEVPVVYHEAALRDRLHDGAVAPLRLPLDPAVLPHADVLVLDRLVLRWDWASDGPCGPERVRVWGRRQRQAALELPLSQNLAATD